MDRFVTQDDPQPTGQGRPASACSVLTIPWRRGNQDKGGVRPAELLLIER